MKGKNIAVGTAVLMLFWLVTLSIAGATSVNVNPAYQEVLQGAAFQVEVNVTDVTNMAADGAILHFDHNAMQATGITAGVIDTFPIEIIDNTAGTVTFAYALMTGGYTGSGPLATIDFTADASGLFDLTLTDVELLDPDLYPIPTDVNNGMVNIGAAGPLLCTNPDPPSHDFGDVPEGETSDWTFDITNCGTGTLTWTVTDDKTWITVNPPSGSNADTITVTIDTTNLACGATYTGTITVSSNDGTKTGTISVYVPCEPLLCTNPDSPSHDFGNVLEGETRDWTFDITNCGTGTLTWTVTDDKTWITVNPPSGSNADTITVTIDTTNLACDTTYTGTITVDSDGGTKTGTISVYVPCPGPLLCTDPDPPSHNFGDVPEGETRDWTFDITNCGTPGTTLDWMVSDDRPWIEVNPASGSNADTITVTIDTTGLACDTTYTGTITVGSDGGTKTGTISVYVPCPITAVPALSGIGMIVLIGVLATVLAISVGTMRKRRN